MLALAYLNSHFQTGIKSVLDRAVFELMRSAARFTATSMPRCGLTRRSEQPSNLETIAKFTSAATHVVSACRTRSIASPSRPSVTVNEIRKNPSPRSP